VSTRGTLAHRAGEWRPGVRPPKTEAGRRTIGHSELIGSAMRWHVSCFAHPLADDMLMNDPFRYTSAMTSAVASGLSGGVPVPAQPPSATPLGQSCGFMNDQRWPSTS
jgi:hypothetical protein